MSERQQMKYHKPSEGSSQYSAEQAHEQLSEDTQKQKAARKAGEIAIEEHASDDFLDEIDKALENLTIETVTEFRQKGGE